MKGVIYKVFISQSDKDRLMSTAEDLYHKYKENIADDFVASLLAWRAAKDKIQQKNIEVVASNLSGTREIWIERKWLSNNNY